VLAFDVGEKRLGIAVSDTTRSIASPVSVIDASALDELRRIVADYEPELLLVGLPLTLSGEEGSQAQKVKAFVKAHLDSFGIKVAFADERFSSVEAQRTARASRVTDKKSRGRLDMIAATVFLQDYLDGCDKVDI
jgi:putative Holliday junction resolvase